MNFCLPMHVEYKRRNGRKLLKLTEPNGVAERVFRAPSIAGPGAEPARLERHDFQDDRLARLVRKAVEQEVITLGPVQSCSDSPSMRCGTVAWSSRAPDVAPRRCQRAHRLRQHVHVPKDVLDEVNQLDEEACGRLGLVVVEGTLEQLLEAGAAGGALSFADWMCLVLARDRGWTCVTNDNRLRRACTDAGVGVLWGLQLTVKLVEAGEIGATDAVDVAEAIRETNPWLSKQVVARFREQVQGGEE